MRFTTDAHTLARALSDAGSVIGSDPKLVAYRGVLLDSTPEGGLTVTGTDGDVTVAIRLDAQLAAPGSALVPPKPLHKYLTSLPSGTRVLLSASGSTEISVTAPDSTPYTFRTLGATLPTAPPAAGEPSALSSDTLAAALRSVRPSAAAGSDIAEPVVHLSSGGDGDLRLRTTDGKRLTQVRIPDGGIGSRTALLRLRTLEQAARSGAHTVMVDDAGKTVTFLAADVTITSRQISDTFPAVDTVLGSRPAHRVTVPAADLSSRLERLRCVAAKGRPVIVKIARGAMTLSMDTSTIGTGTEVLDLGVDGDDVTLAIDLDYLSDAVKAVTQSPSCILTLAWTTPTSPVFITSSADVDVVCVVMPMQI